MNNEPEHPPTKENNHWKKIKAMMENGEIPLGPFGVPLAVIDTFHDKWCNSYRGGFCNCNVVVEIVKVPPYPWN
jgi:hypothetical protein